MGKLIKFEFRKLFKSKYFYIIGAIAIAFVLISGITTKAINDAIVAEGGEATPYSAYLFTKSALSGTFTMLIGIFAALFATEDQTCGTLKNIVAKGYSRTKLYFSKYIVSLVGVLIISALTIAVSYGYGNSIWSNSLEITDNVALIVIGQLLGLLAYHSVFFAISYTSGKVGAAIALNIIGPLGVSLILGMGDAFIKNDNFKLSSFWLDSLFSNFTSSITDTKLIGVGIALLIVYFAIAILVGSLINRRKEIR